MRWRIRPFAQAAGREWAEGLWAAAMPPPSWPLLPARIAMLGEGMAALAGDDRLSWHRDQAAIDAEAALDGIYIIRTPVPASQLDAPATVTAYKNLTRVERDFRSLKADDLDLRPIHHWLQDRVRGHVLICMLAAYLTWHLRAALAPLTYTDEQPPNRADPVAPARRSAHAGTKAAVHASPDGQTLRSFRGLLAHLATLTRATIQLGDVTFDKISDPTPAQRRAFDLIGVTIPLTLTLK